MTAPTRLRVTLLQLGIWSCLAASSAWAQEAGSIFGRVVSSGTGEPLANARIELVGYRGATLSAEDGRFVLVGVPAGDRTVRISLLGYRSLTVDGVFVRAGPQHGQQALGALTEFRPSWSPSRIRPSRAASPSPCRRQVSPRARLAGYAGDGGQARSATFRSPEGVAVPGDGRSLFISPIGP